MMPKTKATTVEQLLDKRKYRHTIAAPPNQVMMQVRNKIVGTLGNYVVFAGLPKVGKSTFIHATVSTLFQPGDMFDIKLQFAPGRRRIGYFDTESGLYDFWNYMERIKQFAMLDNLPQYFDAFRCREDDPATIMQLIETYLQQHTECSVIVIDGLLDLCLNYNDEKETRQLTNWLKRITSQYQLLVIVVIHMAKGKNETIGHLGSNADRWCQSTIEIVRDEENKCLTMKPKLMRSDAYFEPVSVMRFEKEWQQVEVEQKVNNQPTDNDIKQLLRQVYHLQPLYDYRNLVAAIQESAAFGVTKAKQVVKRAIGAAMIVKQEDGRYKLTLPRI